MQRSTPILVLPLLLFLPGSPGIPDGVAPPEEGAADLPPIQWNDNDRGAGTLEEGTLHVELEVRRGAWRPRGEGTPAITVLAFAERGEEPRIPAPMIRVREGTRVRASVTNPLQIPLKIQGLASRQEPDMEAGTLPPGAELPAVRIPPGETREFRFTADARGTYFYRARTPESGPGTVEPLEDALLSGALVVDAPGEGPAGHEEVMVIQAFVGDTTPEGVPDLNEELLTINGRPWPHTERLSYEIGDDVTWRVVNASGAPHPMHLHGFFFQVASRGDIARDTVYSGPQRRKAVTEFMQEWTTMKVSWSPDRPGGWIFHCHLTLHMLPNPRLPDSVAPNRVVSLVRQDEVAHPDRHATHGMGGLVMGLYIERPAGWTPEEARGEPVRLHVREESTEGKALPRFGYAVAGPGETLAEDRVPFPGEPLVLHEGPPARVQVINETDEPTTTHWHGLEVNSFFDGVAGASGYRGRRSPAVMPGDTFEVALRTGRPGTYIYHTHMADLRQQGAGLYGPLIVLPEGEEWRPETDRVYILGQGLGELERLRPLVFLNGSRDPAPERMTAGTAYRLRLINITLGNAFLTFRLVRDGHPVEWRVRAHDGWDVPPQQQELVPARQTVSVGETYDFTYTPRDSADLVLEVRDEAGQLVVAQPIQVAPAPGTGGDGPDRASAVPELPPHSAATTRKTVPVREMR